MSLEQMRQERIKKAAQLRSMGVNPYPYRFERTHQAHSISETFERLAVDKVVVAVAGRLMARRRHGKSTFADLMDMSGRIQLYLRQNHIGQESYDIFNLLSIGDIIGVRGTVFRTRMGEITIQVDELEVLCMSLRPLPDKWHGLKEVETRYRQRYVDLIMNPAVREVFLTRSKIIETIRRVFNAKGGIEVETPTLQPIYGGASARPFKTHHNALDTEFYLRIADELYLKRLIVGGFECVYEICKDFRNEGMDRGHNPEFTMVEIYWAYKDYNDMMELTEELFVTIAQEVVGSLVTRYQGETVDLTAPWARRPMLSLIQEYAGVDVAALDNEGLRAATREVIEREIEPIQLKLQAIQEEGAEERVHLEHLLGQLTKTLHTLDDLNRGNLIEELFDLKVESTLIQPTFVIDYPKETSPLAKVHREEPSLTERFELYICGREMANSFSELNDPIDQRERFEAQMRHLEAGDEEAQPLDEDFLRALEYGMPPTGGLGIGVDRLVMLFTNQSSIQEVILFPQMRPEAWVYEFKERASQRSS